RKELASRFDFKGVPWEIAEEKDKLVLSANDQFKLDALREIVMGKLAKRGVPLKNLEPKEAELSSVGRARQEILLKQGLSGENAKAVSQSVRSSGLKLQAAIEGGKVRVSGKNRDDLQGAIAHLRGLDFPVALSFNNFRE
ncbi:MAG: nucleotide-binding protein, partial [Verrucomicrobia bacterium]|nr:nucleotide-binding protein [Verrucomicrobiota bacterium]